jgi:signal transduction histidine kinase
MKFWQRAFFCIIAVFLLGFDVMGYILAERSYRLNKDYALASSETEQQVIKNSLIESISMNEKNFSELNSANLAMTISPYANYYQRQGIYFQLYQDDELMFSNLPVYYKEESFSILKGEQLIEIKEIENSLYCFIASYLDDPYTNLQYVYIKDMHSLSDFKIQIIKSFTTISIIVSLILAVIMLILLIGLTKPFRRLNTVAAEISNGHYDRRVAIKNRDEVGDFAESFNLMADHIEEHIAALSRMTESKQYFIDNFAHEIRTPITAIIGYGELLKYAKCKDEENKIAIDHIISQGKRILNMSHKLLDLAYMGDESIELHPIKLEDMLTNVKTALNPLLQAKDINLCMSLMPLTIDGDEDLIMSLFTNLIDNAANASEKGNTIDIHVYRETEGVSIDISDHGKGIEKSEIAMITEPFYRVDKSRSRNGGGAGLGLALCARICEIHNASLNIFSEVGKGTTVKILFTTM